jgi:hypothetical protein
MLGAAELTPGASSFPLHVLRASLRPRSARLARADRGTTAAGARGVRPECCSVAHTGLIAALPLSLSGTPKQQCARDLNQLATWPLVVERRAMRSARRVR